MDTEKDKEYIREAIELARRGVSAGLGGPFGCVIVRHGQVVGRGSNEVTSSNDPTAHAEIVAIRDACRQLGHYQLTDCVLYASCEPCPMCLGAIYWARPKRVVYAAPRGQAAAAGFDDGLIDRGGEVAVGDRRTVFQLRGDRGAEGVFGRWREKGDK